MYNFNNSVTSKVRIALFIPSLAVGGSERQLIELAKGLNKFNWEVIVLIMYGGDSLLEEATSLPGVKVINLRKRNSFLFIWKLLNYILKENIEVLYCFLPTAQLYALLIKVFLPKVKIICRIGDSISSYKDLGYKNVIVNFMLKVLRNNSDVYIFNSHAGRKAKDLGAFTKKIKVICNGIDTNRFQPSQILRQKLRSDLKLSEKVILVGCLGNFSVYKDHRTFINAAVVVRQVCKNVHFLTIGDHNTLLGKKAINYVKVMEMESHFTFLGIRKDVECILPALDIGCLSSITEGFPNSICELMASGVPCVVTDVGDAALIVGDAGVVVAKSDPKALANGLISLLKLSLSERIILGQRAKVKIFEQYHLSRMFVANEELLESLLAGKE